MGRIRTESLSLLNLSDPENLHLPKCEKLYGIVNMVRILIGTHPVCGLYHYMRPYHYMRTFKAPFTGNTVTNFLTEKGLLSTGFNYKAKMSNLLSDNTS